MIQENKNLLFQDLCARLPYDVKVEITYSKDSGSSLRARLCCEGINTLDTNILWLFQQSEVYIKPYLFPLSSMTEEQFVELKVFADLTYEGNTLELVEWNDNCKTLEFWLEEIPSYCVIKVFDWLNKNYFDYRGGLIEKGLALDATGLNIYIKI